MGNLQNAFWVFWNFVSEKFLSPGKVRTTVPAFLGAALTFLLNRYGIDLTGFAVDILTDMGYGFSREAVFAFVTSGVTYVVYSVIVEIEKHRPNAGLLLGRRGAPLYGVEVINDDPLVAVDEDLVENGEPVVVDKKLVDDYNDV